MDAQQIACQDFVEVVTDYLEQRLQAELHATCEAHLESCDSCRRYLEQMRRTIGLLGQSVEQTLDPADRAALLARFRSIAGA